ncbi:MAG TPA: hypothetical protein ENI26_10870 [Methylophaga aminisulfidivorans]|uniref:Uncharacterized protein n=1 Tax=Methylophaga aminisulfidivorans TaxID=230105 RepID=A0A7C2AQT1_9GAMM|nr:hypothetical protein [Methylophaga aminisulfidivorans]
MTTIRKPDDATFKTAFNNAELLIETNHDQHHLGQALLFMQQKDKLMTPLINAARAYLFRPDDIDTKKALSEALERLEEFDAQQPLKNGD